MSKAPPLDRQKLRVFIHGLRKQNLLDMLERAIDLMPRTRLSALVEGHVDPADLRPDQLSAASLVADVRELSRASLAGEHHESFAVDSRNYREMSDGTRRWIAECNRLLERCVALGRKGHHPQAREAFELMFGLLRHIDEGRDDVVFFADEGGSWQVGVDWEQVLPAWFECVAKTAGPPDEYALMVLDAIDDFVDHDRERYLKLARAAADTKQRKALKGA